MESEVWESMELDRSKLVWAAEEEGKDLEHGGVDKDWGEKEDPTNGRVSIGESIRTAKLGIQRL